MSFAISPKKITKAKSDTELCGIYRNKVEVNNED